MSLKSKWEKQAKKQKKSTFPKNATQFLSCFKFGALKRLDYTLLPGIQLISSNMKIFKEWMLSITTDGCCTPLILHFFLEHPFHNIFAFIRLSQWLWLFCYFTKEENFLATLWLELFNVNAKKYKATLSDWPHHLMVKHFYPDGSGIFLMMISSLLSGHWKGGWKWKQWESLTVVGAVTTSELTDCGNGNSMLHNYREK